MAKFNAVAHRMPKIKVLSNMLLFGVLFNESLLNFNGFLDDLGHGEFFLVQIIEELPIVYYGSFDDLRHTIVDLLVIQRVEKLDTYKGGFREIERAHKVLSKSCVDAGFPPDGSIHHSQQCGRNR